MRPRRKCRWGSVARTAAEAWKRSTSIGSTALKEPSPVETSKGTGAMGYKTLLEDYRKIAAERGTKAADRHVHEYAKADRRFLQSFDLGRNFEECFGKRLFDKCKDRDRTVYQVITEDS